MDSDYSEDSNWIICRVCLKTSDEEMIKIFKDEDLIAKIEECGDIELKKATYLPDSICKRCLMLLKAATKFRTICKRSQSKLSEKFDSPIRENFEYEQSTTIDDADTPTETVEDCKNIVYSVEYQETHLDISRDDDITSETPFEDLTSSGNKTEFIEPDIDELELVLNVQADRSSNTFKIVPQFSGMPRPSNQRNRKSVKNFENCDAETAHVCPLCGNSYTEKSKLSLHMKIHTKVKPHQCEICLKRFAQTPQLARHMNSHTGSRPFQCKFCSACFADPSTRIKHERIHTNERPYKCTTCEKSFAYSNVLKVHMMTHTGEKPFVCKHCGKQFSQAHHRKNHERLHESSNIKQVKIEDEV